MSADSSSLQDRYGPSGHCFGCGPTNEKGLRIKSFPAEDGTVVLRFLPERHHEAFDGVVNGGIIGCLFDCHSNWTAAWALMQRDRTDEPPSTVTAEFSVKLLRPTPSDAELVVVARAVALDGPRATIEATLTANDATCATGGGVFVAVPPGHPAYHRWR